MSLEPPTRTRTSTRPPHPALQHPLSLQDGRRSRPPGPIPVYRNQCAQTSERRKHPMTAKKPQRPIVPEGDEAQLQQLLEKRHTIAESLRSSSSRAQAETALAAITSNTEGTQLEFL